MEGVIATPQLLHRIFPRGNAACCYTNIAPATPGRSRGRIGRIIWKGLWKKWPYSGVN